MSKLLEKIVYKCTNKFIDKYKLLYDSQYGFQSKRSCEHAILELIGKTVQSKNNKLHACTMFLAHLGYFPMSLCNHDSWIKICMASVYAPSGQSINLSNFIFCRYIT